MGEERLICVLNDTNKWYLILTDFDTIKWVLGLFLNRALKSVFAEW
jgi:hypothetical protein